MHRPPREIVAAGYDTIAVRYAEWQQGVVGDPRGTYVDTLLTLVPPSPDVLELGCGAGVEPTPTLARRGRLVGVDISRAQIERARAAAPEATFIQDDLTRVTFPPASFDAVVALYVLTHIPTAAMPTLLERIGDWLRPGGLLLATLGAANGEGVVDDWLGVPMFFSGSDRRENERLLRGAGLALRESRVERMEEPESEPGAGPATVAFHWVLAEKG